MRIKGVSCSVAVAATLLMACAQMPSARQGPDPVENLRAFAKLYGYIRYFHPSDEAAETDWARFAIYGSERVLAAPDRDALRAELERLFLPIAPTLQIYASENGAPPAPAALTPEDPAELALVAWQHYGVALDHQRSMYRSQRLNRAERVMRSAFAPFSQRLDATLLRGQEVRLRADLRAEVTGPGNQAQLWLRVDREHGQMGFFDNMKDRPVTRPDWQTYEISGRVDDDAESLLVGGFLQGQGTAWFTNFRLDARHEGGAWRGVALHSPGFGGAANGAVPAGWGGGAKDYGFVVVADDTREGVLALRVRSQPSLIEDPLFEARPAPGETLSRPLSRGLSAQWPVSLYSKDEHTVGTPDAAASQALKAALATVDLEGLSATSPGARLAGVVIAWNVFQHFYPYFDVVDTDWDAVLTEALRRALQGGSEQEHLHTLRWLVAQLHDGHGNVWHPSLDQTALPPFSVDWVQDRVVVVATADAETFQVGDIVLTLDGEPATEVVHREAAFFSGTERLRRYRALHGFGRGERGSEVTLEIQRADEQQTVIAPRNRVTPLREPRPEDIEQIEEGIWYVNLDTAEMARIDAHLEQLSTARGVIFDLRGYPKGNQDVLRHLTNAPLNSQPFEVPQTIYPDRDPPPGLYTAGRWLLEPRLPRIQGTVAFLTDSRAISYAESVLSIVQHYGLGEIIGQPTAGTNGNINRFQLPGGYGVVFTGMRVRQHDGSPFHLVGVHPTIPVQRTLKGVRAGRDEFLERALALIRE